MFCRNCGNQLAEGALFCSACGAKVEAPAQPVYNEQPAPTQPVYNQPQNNDTQAAEYANQALTWGIIAVVLAEFGFLGCIFGAKAKNLAARYVDLTGALNAKARVGQILGTVAVILGIVMTVIWALYILYFVFFAALAFGGGF